MTVGEGDNDKEGRISSITVHPSCSCCTIQADGGMRHEAFPYGNDHSIAIWVEVLDRDGIGPARNNPRSGA